MRSLPLILLLMSSPAYCTPDQLSLERAISIALRENPAIAATTADASRAKASFQAALSQTKPSLSANVLMKTGDMSGVMRFSPGVDPSALSSFPAHGFADQNLAFMVPIYTDGKLNGLVNTARFKENAATVMVNSVKLDTILKVREAYYRALLYESLKEQAVARLAFGTAMTENAQSMFAEGKGIEASVQRAKADVEEAKRSLNDAVTTHEKALLDLKNAMGVRPEIDFSLTGSLSDYPVIDRLADYIADANRLRPDLQAIRFEVLAANAEMATVKGTYGPQIYGSVMVNGFSSNETGLGAGYTVGVTVSIPLLEGGRRKADLDQAKAIVDRTEAKLKLTVLQVETEVRQAWLDIEESETAIKSSEAELTSAKSAYEVIVLRVQNQKALQVEQLDALTAVTQAGIDHAQALYKRDVAIANLERAAGRIRQ